ncbi:MAG: hypothetical protein AAF791_06045 [Bacteroidota bacterium]
MLAITPKQIARQVVDRSDDDASFEDIQYELYVAERIQRGLRDVEEGRTISHEDARARLSRWLGDTPITDG